MTYEDATPMPISGKAKGKGNEKLEELKKRKLEVRP
jgi:hypothetical protein